MDRALRAESAGESRRRRLILLWLLVVFWGTHGGRVYLGDALGSLETARSLVQGQGLAIPEAVDTEGSFGPDGRFYSWFGLLPFLYQVPAAALGRSLPAALGGLPRNGELYATRFLASLPALAFALILGLAYLEVTRRLGCRARWRVAATLALAFATPVWVYAGLDSPDLPLGLFLLLALAAAVADREATAGALLGAALCTKFTALGAAPGVLLAARRGQRRRVLLGLAPWVVAWALFNHARYGHPLDTGYPAAFAGIVIPFPLGLLGMLMSFGKGLVCFAPVTLVALLGWPVLARRSPRLAWGAALAVAGMAGGYSLAVDWAGDPGWGPRYAMAFLPLACLGLPDGLARARGPYLRPLALAAIALGTWVNATGALVDVTAYPRALAAQAIELGLAPGKTEGLHLPHLRAQFYVPDLAQVRVHTRLVLAWVGGSRDMVLPSGRVERRDGKGRYKVSSPPVMRLPAAPLDAWWFTYRAFLSVRPASAPLYAIALLSWLLAGYLALKATLAGFGIGPPAGVVEAGPGQPVHSVSP